MSAPCCLCRIFSACCFCCCPCCFKTVALKTTYIPLDGESTPRPIRNFRWCCAFIATLVVIGLGVAIFYPILNFGIVPPVGKKLIKKATFKLETIEFNSISLRNMEVENTAHGMLMDIPGSPVDLKVGYTTIKVKNQNNMEFAQVYLQPMMIPSGKDPEVMAKNKFKLTSAGNFLSVIFGIFSGTAMIQADMDPRVKAVGGYLNARVKGKKMIKLPKLSIRSLIADLRKVKVASDISLGNTPDQCRGLDGTCVTQNGMLSLTAVASFADVKIGFGNAYFHVYDGSHRGARLVGNFSTTNFGLQKGTTNCTKGNILAFTARARMSPSLYLEGPINSFNTTMNGRKHYMFNTSSLRMIF